MNKLAILLLCVGTVAAATSPSPKDLMMKVQAAQTAGPMSGTATGFGGPSFIRKLDPGSKANMTEYLRSKEGAQAFKQMRASGNKTFPTETKGMNFTSMARPTSSSSNKSGSGISLTQEQRDKINKYLTSRNASSSSGSKGMNLTSLAKSLTPEQQEKVNKYLASRSGTSSTGKMDKTKGNEKKEREQRFADTTKTPFKPTRGTKIYTTKTTRSTEYKKTTGAAFQPTKSSKFSTGTIDKKSSSGSFDRKSFTGSFNRKSSNFATGKPRKGDATKEPKMELELWETTKHN